MYNNSHMSSQSVPAHIGFILDGNRRWARENGLKTLEGHKKGLENLNEIAKYSFKRGVTFVSAYVFSIENWKRTEEEVGYLMSLVTKALDDYLDTFHEEGIKIVILGRRDGLRSKVLKAINKAEETTCNNTNGTIGLCFNYGGQEEIADAVQRIISLKPDTKDVTTELISSYIYGPEIPPIDLVIRTSGEQRLSGFMLWRASYAELLFTNKHWPAFTTNDLDESLEWYANRERRFGK